MEANVASKIMSKQGGPRYLVIRNIHNLDKLPAATGRYGIFSGEPGAIHLTAAGENFLGEVADVPTGGKLEHQGPLTAALDVSGKLTSLLSDNKNRLNLTVAALEAGDNATGPSIPLEADSISIIE
jgi:hypothetical protein